MDKDKDKNQKFIRIFLGFTVCVIVMTFFSKSFYNYRLPEVTVAVAEPKQGSLAFSVEGTSEIYYAQVNSVYGEVDGRVSDIAVITGEQVTKGQCIMTFQTTDEEVTEITAKMDGMITSLGVEEGMYVSSMQNTVLYEMAVPSEGLICTLFLTEEQTENFDDESMSVLTLQSTGERIDSSIVEVISYADQSKTGYLAKIEVNTENTELAGSRVNVMIKQESEKYDTLIPVSALHKDSTGYYVLVLKEDDSVLGNDYAVQRMSVDLLDSDESYCAVRGLLNDERVVVAATGEITDGSKVYYGGDGVQ